MKLRITIGSQRRFLAGITSFIIAHSAVSQAAPGPADARLDTKVTYSSQQASVQDIIQDLVGQAGLKYDRQKSFAQTDPLCRQWVRNVAIEAKPCREAFDQILKPVGLRYELANGTVVLSRPSRALAPAKGYVTTQQPPAGLSPATTLSPAQQRENFDFLCKAIDETYACFELKSPAQR